MLSHMILFRNVAPAIQLPLGWLLEAGHNSSHIVRTWFQNSDTVSKAPVRPKIFPRFSYERQLSPQTAEK